MMMMTMTMTMSTTTTTRTTTTTTTTMMTMLISLHYVVNKLITVSLTISATSNVSDIKPETRFKELLKLTLAYNAIEKAKEFIFKPDNHDQMQVSYCSTFQIYTFQLFD